MGETAIERHNGSHGGALIEQVVIQGDLKNLTSDQRAAYYRTVCDSLGLNPYTKPFAYIELNEKLTLYALRDATDQLRKLHAVSVKILSRELVQDVYVVTAGASTPDGRGDESIGAVALVRESGEWKTATSGKRYFAKDGKVVPLGPDDRANAMMKAETKAKRRVTLSICGLGWMDETETETVPGAVRVEVETPRAPAGPSSAGAPPQGASRQPSPADELDALADASKPAPAPVGRPAWWDTPLGKEISQVVDALTAEQARFSEPADEASEQELSAWLDAKRGWLASRRQPAGAR